MKNDDDRPVRVQLVNYTPTFWEELTDMFGVYLWVGLGLFVVVVLDRLTR